MSVIDSLSAGYRLLGRRVELLLVPVLLDLLLWLGPRLSIAPLFAQVADFYRDAGQMQGMPAELGDMSRQAAELLATAGRDSNLVTNLAGSAFLHTPSLLASVAGLSQGAVVEIDSFLTAGLYFVGLGLLGLLVGVVYLNLLARVLPIGSAGKPSAPSEFTQVILRQWRSVVIYVVMIFLALLMVSIPVGLVMGVLGLLSPVLASLLALFVSGAVLVLSFYLYFVTAAIVVDDLPVRQAVVQSFTLVRGNFWATLGFVVLYNVIAIGFILIVGRIAEGSGVGMAVAILMNAYIGSGLTLALLVFYRSRILKHEELARFTDAA